MDTCDQYRDLLWLSLYGLLEAGESESLRAHLASCGLCQAEMAQAEAHQQLLAQAAHFRFVIAPFTPPLSEPDTVPLPADSLRSAEGRRMRFWPWLATAAAVLLLIGLPYAFLQRGLVQRQDALREAEEQVAEIVTKRQEAQQQAWRAADALVSATRAKYVRIQLLGPASYQAGAPNLYQIATTDLDGHALDADVEARLLAADNRPLFQVTAGARQGNLHINFPPDLQVPPGGAARLEVVARRQEAQGQVQEMLPMLDKAYRTHLAIDKPVYRPGEKVFFRWLALERFGLKPAQRPFAVTYTMTDPQGRSVYHLSTQMRADGIGGGELVLPATIPDGECALTVTEAENRFSPVTRKFLLQHDPASRLRKAIPPALKSLQVEFFPEGGDLVGDVSNRVYFRVRTPSGQPADLKGRIVDSRGHVVVAVQTARSDGQPVLSRGLGVFTFTPQDGESYRLQVTSPEGIGQEPALPAARVSGIALSVPTSVDKEGRPVRAVLQNAGPERQMILAVACRGRLATQMAVSVKPGRQEFVLGPTLPAVSGMLRITAFEVQGGRLLPVAERLLYQIPARKLVLSVQADKELYRPGERVRLDLRSVDEKGKPKPAWLLVSVVDQAVVSLVDDPAEQSLPAFFCLTSELEKPEDLEQADFLLDNGPRAAAALDLYLGTQGWRRFREPVARPALAMNQDGATQRGVAPDALTLVQWDNAEQVERQCAAALARPLAGLENAVAARDRDLLKEGEGRLQQARDAEQELRVYSARSSEYIRLAAVLGVVIVFAGGSVLLAIALVRLLRGLQMARPYFVAAFASLLLCLGGVLGLANHVGRVDDAKDAAAGGRLAQALEKPLDLPLALKDGARIQAQKTAAPHRLVSEGVARVDQAATEKRSTSLSYREGQEVASRDNPPMPNPKAPGPAVRVHPLVKPMTVSPAASKVMPSPAGGQVAASPLQPREYAYLRSSDPANANPEAPDTILWHPFLLASDGTARVTFDLPPRPTTYRVRVEGHSASGRLGALQKKLESPPNAAPAPK